MSVPMVPERWLKDYYEPLHYRLIPCIEELGAAEAQVAKLEGELRQERDRASEAHFALGQMATAFHDDSARMQAQVSQLQTTIGQLTAERNALCLDCMAVKRRAYSDASTPGFFFDTCAKHRVATITAKPEGAV